MGRIYLVVEGHGEVRAALNLITRLTKELELPLPTFADPPLRGVALHTRAGVLKTCEILRRKSDCVGCLLLRDEDDGCPAARGPEAAAWVAEAGLSFPVAVVLAHCEYEAWFLPCIHLLAGRPLVDPNGQSRPGIRPGTTFQGNPESIRGVKEWLTRHFPDGKSYKPTLDQLSLTRMLDLSLLRASQVPSFDTLIRALGFLAAPGERRVYPPARPSLPR